jgi:hypothetical protein
MGTVTEVEKITEVQKFEDMLLNYTTVYNVLYASYLEKDGRLYINGPFKELKDGVENTDVPTRRVNRLNLRVTDGIRMVPLDSKTLIILIDDTLKKKYKKAAEEDIAYQAAQKAKKAKK